MGRGRRPCILEGPLNYSSDKRMKRCSKRKKTAMMKTETRNRKEHQHQLPLPSLPRKTVCPFSDVADVDGKNSSDARPRHPAREKRKTKEKRMKKDDDMYDCHLKMRNESPVSSWSIAGSRQRPWKERGSQGQRLRFTEGPFVLG